MPYVPSDINNTAYLPSSSGTTGMPKAVEISHSNVISMVEIFCKTPSLLPKNQDRSEMQFRTLNLLPLFHTYALILRLRKVDKSISETAARASRAKQRSFKSYRVVSRCVSLSRCDDLQLDCRAADRVGPMWLSASPIIGQSLLFPPWVDGLLYLRFKRKTALRPRSHHAMLGSVIVSSG